MNRRTRAACLYAAVAAVSFGVPELEARDLIWDWSPGDGVPHDGSGTWDLASNNWVDAAVPGVNTVFANGDNVTFGGGTSGVGSGGGLGNYYVDIPVNLTAGNLTLADVPLDKGYDIGNINTGFGSLTLNGNLSKTGDNGNVNFFLTTTLSAGNHNVVMRDSPGDIVEFIFNGNLGGTGGLTIDNGPYEAWGTLAFNQTNSYTGVTNINKGRIVLTNAGGLGSNAALSGTNIGDTGTLSFYGAGTVSAGDLNVSEPITITRSQYAEAGGEFGRYNGAVTAFTGNHTLSGPVTLNTIDARFQVNGPTNSLTISSNIAETSPSRLSKTGDGVLFLTGTNAYTAGTAMHNGTVAITSDANIGGPATPLFFNGGYLRVPTTWANFGSHPIDNTDWAGGVDVPGASQVFTISQSLTGSAGEAGFFGKRGPGTLTVTGTNVFTGTDRVDAGTYNVNGSVKSLGLRINTATVNINNGGSYETTGQWSNIGTEPGTVGVLNMSGNATFLSNASDFNVSDNPNTTGTLNMSGTSVLTSKGPFLVSKNTGTVARVVLNDTATINADKTGGDSFAIGRGNATDGKVTNNGGTIVAAGEFWVGSGGGGKGEYVQTAGQLTAKDWFVVGRFDSQGTADISGGTITKTGDGIDDNNNAAIDERGEDGHTEFDVNGGAATVVTFRNNAVFNAVVGDVRVGVGGASNATVTIRDTAAVNVQRDELWIGQGGGSTGVVTVQDSGTLSVNNWFAIGRAGGTGTLNMAGNATVTKTGGGAAIIGAGGSGTLNQASGTFTHTSGETWIAEGGTAGTWNLSGGTANVARLDVGRNGGGAATLAISNTGAMTAADVIMGNADGVTATVNLSGGSLQANNVVSGGGTGAEAFNFTGGRLSVGTYGLAAPLANTGSGTLAPGGVGTVGTSTITPGYTQGANAALTVDLASAASYDAVNSPAAVNLDGTLNVNRVGGFTPAAPNVTAGGYGKGDVFTIVTGAPVSGTFATVNGLDYANRAETGRTLRMDYQPDRVEVQAFQYAAGDTNQNQTVNSQDIFAINVAGKFGQGNVGATSAQGDFDNDGDVDSFDIFRINQAGRFNAGTYNVTSFSQLGAADATANLAGPGAPGDGILTLVYDPSNGSLTVEADGLAYNGVIIQSATGIFTGAPAAFPGDAQFTTDTNIEISFLKLSGTFADMVALGNVAQTGLTQGALQTDLTIDYTLSGGGAGVGDVRVVPEPGTGVFLLAGLAGVAGIRRRRAAQAAA